MSKKKYTAEVRVRVAQRHLQGDASAREIAAEIGITKSGERTIRKGAAIYRENGIEGFHLTKRNRSYTGSEKKNAAEERSQREVCREYHITSKSIRRNWIKVYNSNRALWDYDPNRRYINAGCVPQY